MKKSIAFALYCMFLAFATTATAAENALPKPVTEGGKSVLASINARASALRDQFPVNPISMQDLSTLLWAASGRKPGRQRLDRARGPRQRPLLYCLRGQSGRCVPL